VNRIRGPFNVTLSRRGGSCGGGARFGLHLGTRRAHNAKWRGWLTNASGSNAIRAPPSQGNFVLALFEDAATAKAAFSALACYEGLLAREMHGYGIPDRLRISIGLEEPMRRAAAIPKAFGAPGAVTTCSTNWRLIGIGLIGSSIARATRLKEPRQACRHVGNTQAGDSGRSAHPRAW